MLRVLALVATTAILLAACGGATSTLSGGNGVTVQGSKFDPTTLEVPVGTTVTWTNKDNIAHTVTSGTPSAKDGKFDGALDPTSGTFAFTLSTAGTFKYFCQNHPTTMLATIVVK